MKKKKDYKERDCHTIMLELQNRKLYEKLLGIGAEDEESKKKANKEINPKNKHKSRKKNN